jgi:hypothetical protein
MVVNYEKKITFWIVASGLYFYYVCLFVQVTKIKIFGRKMSVDKWASSLAINAKTLITKGASCRAEPYTYKLASNNNDF